MLTQIGKGWKKSGQKGQFYSCVIDTTELPSGSDVRVLIFPVKNKRSERQPDIDIFLTDDRPDEPKQAPVVRNPLDEVNAML